MSLVIPAQRKLSDLSLRHVRLRCPLYHPEIPFIILWSQKAACTPVVMWFFLQCGLLTPDLRKQGAGIHAFEHRVFKKQPSYIQDLVRAAQSGKPILKFVRDPYARAYSSYLETCEPMCLKNRSYWGADVRKQIVDDLTKGSSNADESAMEYAYTFRQYLDWLAQQNPRKLNNHIRPQHLPRDTFFDLRICKVERLADEFASLEREFNLPFRAADNPDVFESRHFHKKTDGMPFEAAQGLLDLAIPPLRTGKFPFVKFDKKMAEGTSFEKLVKRCFANDIRLYGYS
jgi:hypothetical protein